MAPVPLLASPLVDLELSPEHELLRRTIRDFLAREVADKIDEHEQERRFPTDVVAELGQMGLLGIPFPEEEGGAGLDTLAYAIAIEELARVWGSLAIIVAAHTSLGCNPLHIAGTDEQKQKYLVPMASGQVLGAYGLTEPEAGSDSGGTRTTAKFKENGRGGQWVINGGKRFITNAGQAGTYIVTARTGDREDGSAEISAFIVEQSTPGFTVGRLEEKLGLHASATGELLFEDCQVPAANMPLTDRHGDPDVCQRRGQATAREIAAGCSARHGSGASGRDGPDRGSASSRGARPASSRSPVPRKHSRWEPEPACGSRASHPSAGLRRTGR